MNDLLEQSVELIGKLETSNRFDSCGLTGSERAAISALRLAAKNRIKNKKQFDSLWSEILESLEHSKRLLCTDPTDMFQQGVMFAKLNSAEDLLPLVGFDKRDDLEDYQRFSTAVINGTYKIKNS